MKEKLISKYTEDDTSVAVVLPLLMLIIPTVVYSLLYQPSYLLLIIITIIFSVIIGYLMHLLVLKISGYENYK